MDKVKIIKNVCGLNTRTKLDNIYYTDTPYFVLNKGKKNLHCFYNNSCMLINLNDFGLNLKMNEWCSKNAPKKLLCGLIKNAKEIITVDVKQVKEHLKGVKKKEIKDKPFEIKISDGRKLYLNPQLLLYCLEFCETDKLYFHDVLSRVGFISEDKKQIALLMPIRK